MTVSRRRVLGNAALMTLLAPVLRRRDAAGAAASPRRVILVYSPCGPMNAAGPATGTETAFSMHDWWKPLERHRADGIFMSHMAVTGAGGVVAAEGHDLGGQIFGGGGVGYNGSHYLKKSATIDQVIGKRLDAEGRAGIRPAAVWGLESSAVSGIGNAFVAAPGRDILPQVAPDKAWSDLFAALAAAKTGPVSAEEMKRAQAFVARRQSVLDFVNDDCKALTDVLGAEGVRLLDDHCTGLRSMEKSLTAGFSGAAVTCAKPAKPSTVDPLDPENRDPQMGSFIDLMAATLACELSHVIAFQFGGVSSRLRIGAKYGVPSSPLADSGDSGPAHHPWTHQRNSAMKTQAMQAFTTFYASQVALIFDKLKSTMDANGQPLSDSTVLVWASELGGNEQNRDAHHTGCVPIVLLGRGQGVFKTGRYLRGKSPDTGNRGADVAEAGRDTARLLVAIMQYMGLADVQNVGLMDVKGPLMSLYA